MKRPSVYGMPPIETRREFERNMFLVCEHFTRVLDGDNEELKANAVWAEGEHLKRLRILPNGRIDLLTIDEALRNSGNMRNWMRNMSPSILRRQEEAGAEPDEQVQE